MKSGSIGIINVNAATIEDRSNIRLRVWERGAGLTQSTEAERAAREVTDFAADIRGLPREELIRTTTAIDIEAANTSTIDPNNLPADGVAGTDTRGDNDGLYQRWEDTCGPTTAQLTRAEADPVFARQLHRDGIGNPDATDPTGQQQIDTLRRPRFFDASSNEVFPTAAEVRAWEADNTRMPAGADSVEVGESSTRRATQAAERTEAAISASGLPEFAQRALRRQLDGEELGFIDRTVANYALAQVREQNGGNPTADEVRWMQTERNGSNGMRLDPALHDIATPATNHRYDARWVNNDLGAHLGDVDTRLRDGQDVPFRVSNAGNTGGHFMLMSDVRGEAPDRQYLVSDPYSGRTAWVSEGEMTDTSNDWLSRRFDIGWDRVSHIYPEQ